MTRWFAYQVAAGGLRCVGEVWAADWSEAYSRALAEFRCRIDFLSRQPA